MTTNNRSWRRAGAFATIATVSALGVGLAAGTAQAHTPVWEVTCTEVSVDLTAYSPKEDNTVTVTVDGKDLLPAETFKGNFHKKLELPKHDKELTVRLVVKAGDDDKFSRDESKTAPVCNDKPSPSPTPEKPSPSTPAPSETPSDTPSTATSSAEVPPASTKPSPSGDLAETGSSSSTPLIAGAAALVIVAGGGIMWAARKRRSAQH
ncbi:LPXTG cell wall anchor domain-containing protein [Streptomyces sp. NBC_00879]|uniref:LAETG motif-containing sortase-dependent surface protein n=1 Tax=Streptomyces sp. NBC_00879 TaxID=2975855 RepID=UPI0038688566|nr:LPXTG cell wall anchor domain-containing protein [Streptomyces sp. NBC_00879]